MNIIEKTRELGEMIQSSEQMKNLKEKEALQAQDENAKTYMAEFNMKSMNLARDMQNGTITREDAIKQNNEAFEHMVNNCQIIKEYVQAQQEVDKMVKEINDVLTFYITGKEPGCTHDCGSCGGCH